MSLLPDIVYVVRPGDDNQELRHSLRSLRNIPHRRVLIAGHVPSWVRGVVGVPTTQSGTRYENSTHNLFSALMHPKCGPNVLLMNDDFFIMRPLPQVPILHRGSVEEVEAYYANRGYGPYLEGLRQTRDLMNSLGIHRPLSYELHVPFPIDRDNMLKAIEVGQDLPVLHKRTLYGNLFEIGGGRMKDVKVLQRGWAFSRNAAFLSTSPTAYRTGVVGDWIRQQHPSPCRYEGLVTY